MYIPSAYRSKFMHLTQFPKFDVVKEPGNVISLDLPAICMFTDSLFFTLWSAITLE